MKPSESEDPEELFIQQIFVLCVCVFIFQLWKLIFLQMPGEQKSKGIWTQVIVYFRGFG